MFILYKLWQLWKNAPDHSGPAPQPFPPPTTPKFILESDVMNQFEVAIAKVFRDIEPLKQTEHFQKYPDVINTSAIAIAAHIALLCLHTPRRVSVDERRWFNGGVTLARVFGDRQNEAYEDLFGSYLKMVKIVKNELF